MKPLPILATLALGLAVANPVRAYTFESSISKGCHESITTDALRNVRQRFPKNVVPIDTNRDEKALVRDLQFRPADDLSDLTGATLLIGVRDNDLKGLGAAEVDNLAQVHGDPDHQREHCLRDRDDDQPDGTAKAVANCRAYIKEQVTSALGGLNPDSTTNTSVRTDFEITLELRRKVTASMPLFWFRMGQAMHALEDSFAHTFRSPDRKRVRVVMNWIDYVEAHDNESRDGPQHRAGMDECEDVDAFRQNNKAIATDAATALLAAALDPSLDHDAKLAAVDKVLDTYLTADDIGCSQENAWCNAPELQYSLQPSCGCSIVGDSRGETIVAGLAAAALALAVVRRRRTENK